MVALNDICCSGNQIKLSQCLAKAPKLGFQWFYFSGRVVAFSGASRHSSGWQTLQNQQLVEVEAPGPAEQGTAALHMEQESANQGHC